MRPTANGTPGTRISSPNHNLSNGMTSSKVLSGPGVGSPSCMQVQTALEPIPSIQQELSKPVLRKQLILVPPGLALKSVSALWCGGPSMWQPPWLPALHWLETTSSSPFSTAAHTQALGLFWLLPKSRVWPQYAQPCYSSQPLTRGCVPPLSRQSCEHHQCCANHASWPPVFQRPNNGFSSENLDDS